LVIVFVAVVLVLIGLAHFWMWKRLIRDTARSKAVRRTGAAVFAVLGLLVPATFAGVQSNQARWIAWPGYLWIGLMFYLLLALAVMELVRLAVRLSRRGTARRTRSGPATPATAPSASPQPSTPAVVRSESKTDGDVGGGIGGRDGAEVREKAAREVSERAGRGGGENRGGNAPDKSGQEVDDKVAGKRGIERRLVLARGTAITAGLAAAAITGYGMKTALGRPQLNRVQIPIAKLPRSLDGTRLAVVSDIHLGPLTGTHHTGRIVDMINSVDADIVCVVGDLVDGTVAELGRFAEPLRDLRSRQGAYFVTGNHEYYSGFQPWVDEVARLGVRPLRNERLELGGLDLAGVNDLNGTQYGDPPDFGQALGDRDPTRPVVLMAHQPKAAVSAAPYGVDLQVSGHTHGGQMAPFNLVVRLEQPIVSGFGRVAGVPVYVTNGAGFWGPPMRVGAPPQVTVIDLRTP
jgi:predicted MPP superfamily phosphohydrolase